MSPYRESLSGANKIRSCLPPRVGGVLLSSDPGWQSTTTTTHVLPGRVGGVEGSVFCPLCLAREMRAHPVLQRPGPQRQPSGGGGDGVPAAASSETMGDPPNSRGRAGPRTRPHFPVSVRYYRLRVWWAGAKTWQEAVEAVVGARLPLPLNQPPTLWG